MNFDYLVNRMTINAVTIEKMVTGLDPEQLIWKPAPEKWSIHEVIWHLYNEEFEDFRTRVDYTLHKPGEAWPPIDTEKTVADYDQLQHDFQSCLDSFLDERASSLVWLKKLENPDWDLFYTHPQVGPLRAGDLFGSWVSHDFMHIRQISNLNILWLQQHVAPYDIKYAAP